MKTQEACRDQWLLRLLLSSGRLKKEEAEAVGRPDGGYASTELTRRGMLSAKDLADAVQEYYHIPFAEPEPASLDRMAVSLIPEKICRRHRIIPLKLREDSVELLMANPIDASALDEAAAVAGRKAVAIFGMPDRIEELIGQAYSSDAAIIDILKKMPEEVSVEIVERGGDDDGSGLNPEPIGTPVVRLANLLISQAVQMRASDVHIEHEESKTLVRYRVDGLLKDIMRVPKHIGEGPLVSRIKIMANLDIADHRKPQDGRAKLKVGGRDIGLRVSTVPTAFGEKVVLRILDDKQAQVLLEDLGFRPETLERITRISESNQGLFLMTGPTGSGKTTTLYSLLHRLKSPDINIVTVEDPIEYRLPGINQVQVNEKAGLTFASVLRSVLRQDPDIVLVGEIRDRETADIALQAALTGHMVFSTLHTNDAVATINRLMDMGVELYKMAPALVGVISQRLARRVCPSCKVEEPANPTVAEFLRAEGLPLRQFKGKGCAKCSSTGLLGRTTVTEILDLTDQGARDMVAAGGSTAALREKAIEKKWLITMKRDILWHLANGDIPFEEAAALLGTEFSAAKAAASQGRPEREKAGATAPSAAPAQTPQAAAVPAGAGAAKGGEILIVDDNLDNRILARDVLAPEGYRIVEAEDGLKAVEKIGERKPDLVLLDIMMPQMDGFAVLKRLRQEMKLADLPIMVLTAMSEAESQTLALELGADDYMTKPFNPKVLKARVQALFRRLEAKARA